ncbi:MAG: HAD family hydrolase [Lachnospiraceae bacterium]|nr:HAD family hydrolase [Lachnospiraceae bacterium]
MWKPYKAVFFDWDGTAVMSRRACADDAVAAMKPALRKGKKLVIVSGTTYENIIGGRIQDYFTTEELDNLYLGLGRGAYNYHFENGQPVIFTDCVPDKENLLKIHDVCYQMHRQLLEKYDFKTDIVFTRPNYCKLDLAVENDRGEQLFMQGDEIDALREKLKSHGITDGIEGLIELAVETGKQYGVAVSATCDAKYLEIGISDKSDNTRIIFTRLQKEYGIQAKDCSFWGDEFVGIQDHIFGSDAFMLTEETKEGDFYDVSTLQGARPGKVQHIGGGVDTFLDFLRTL